MNRKLQSPVENHFALTPTTNSESSSPKNGFTSLEGTSLLQEELNQLVLDEELKNKEKVEMPLPLKNSISVDGLQSPTDGTINMFVRVENDVLNNPEALDVIIEPVEIKKEENTTEVSAYLFKKHV